MKKQKFLIFILILVIIFSFTILFLVMDNYFKEKRLRKELDETIELVNNSGSSNQKINEKLNTLVSSGDYKIVEKALKDYFKDVLNTIDKMNELLKSNEITDILTIENYKKDAPLFVKTKEYISSTRDSLNNYITQIEKYITNEKIMSYIDTKKLSSNCINIYKEYAFLEENVSINELKKAVDDLLKYLDSSEKVISFLITNQKKWSIKEDKIIFINDTLVKEYNTLINTLK